MLKNQCFSMNYNEMLDFPFIFQDLTRGLRMNSKKVLALGPFSNVSRWRYEIFNWTRGGIHSLFKIALFSRFSVTRFLLISNGVPIGNRCFMEVSVFTPFSTVFRWFFKKNPLSFYSICYSLFSFGRDANFELLKTLYFYTFFGLIFKPVLYPFFNVLKGVL